MLDSYMRYFPCFLTLLALLLTPVTLPADPVQSLYDLKVHSLDDKPVDLAQYKGKVVLVVNTASKCGFTPQYAGLEKLYLDYKDKGFVILGFPSNDFGGQEPGTPQEIATFCTSKYNVTFPMFEKVVTKGEGQAPVYQFLTTGFPAPTWNFCKYLVDKNGKVISEFPSKVTPESPELHSAIDAQLKG
ncbi:MAG TPA: glutathione peroxidase [Candidatus Methylacidiphilales bacterium]